MSAFFQAIQQHPDPWLPALFLVCAVVLGAGGNWLALRLLSGPLPFKGRRGQGILGEQMVAVANGLGQELARYINLSELFRLMEPEKIAAHINDSVRGRLEDYVDAAMAEKHAVLWDNLPNSIRYRFYGRVRRQLPSILDNLVDDMAENVDQLVNVQALINELLSHDPALLNRLFEEALQPERRFLIYTGLATGLFLGLLETVLWWFFPRPWLLVVGGVALAVACLWLPRQLLLHLPEPQQRWSLLPRGWIYHRQSRVMTILAHRLTEEVLSLQVMTQALLSGARAHRTQAMIKRHMRPLLDAGVVRTSMQLLLGAQGYASIKQQVVERAVQMTITSLSDAAFNHDRAMPVQEICTNRLVNATPRAFQALVQPLLNRSLWVQMMVQVGLGLVVGGGQWLLWRLV